MGGPVSLDWVDLIFFIIRMLFYRPRRAFAPELPVMDDTLKASCLEIEHALDVSDSMTIYALTLIPRVKRYRLRLSQ